MKLFTHSPYSGTKPIPLFTYKYKILSLDQLCCAEKLNYVLQNTSPKERGGVYLTKIQQFTGMPYAERHLWWRRFLRCYLAMSTIGPLCMKEVHKVASFVRLLNIFNSLHDQIGTRTNSSNSQKDITRKKIRSQSLHINQIANLSKSAVYVSKAKASQILQMK